MTSAPVSSVIVAGGGLTAWSAAAALRRRIPSLDVTIVGSPIPADALADRMISTLPSVHRFHADLGLADEDTIHRARSGLRLGSLFRGWAEGLPDYVHAYGPYGCALGGVSFHQLWLRERGHGALPPFDHFSPAAEMARAGRMPGASAAEIQPGLQLTLADYGALIRAYALHLGVRELPGPISGVALSRDGATIARLDLAGGASASADLFVDCTGPAAMLRSTLRKDFVEWSSWLLCDRVAIGGGEPVAEAQVMDRTSASAHGWGWLASSPQRSSCGFAYSSAHARTEDLAQEQRGTGTIELETVALRQGRWADLWVGNCVAIGDAAVAVEPLEFTNLHLAHSQIDRVVTSMPGSDWAQVELAEFNRQCAAEADRVRDFVCLHYICARREEPFWRDARSVAPPQSLAHSLTLFSERGRLPFYEEETFSRDSWLAVLLGQGVEPRHVDPLADLVPRSEAARAFAKMGQSLSSFTLPEAPVLPGLNPHGIR